MAALTYPVPPRSLRTLLRTILKQKGLDSTTVYDLSLTTNREDCVTNVYRVVVYPDNTDFTRRIALYLKCYPIRTSRSDTFCTPVFFDNEVVFYDQVLPAMLAFQRDRNVKRGFRGVPKCYRTVHGRGSEVLVMEDLESRGFITLNRMQGMNIEEIRITLQELGRFHALSLAMKHRKPEDFAKAKSELKEVLFTDRQKPVYGKLFRVATQDALQLVQTKHPGDNPYVAKMSSFSDAIFDIMARLATPDPEHDKYNVITQGDPWINNFRFRYKDSGHIEHVNRMCFLDFQLARYGSLALDVTSILYLTMDKPARATHRDSLLRSYYEAFRRLLLVLGSDPDEALPYHELETLLRKYAKFGVGMACLNLPIQLHEEDGVQMEDVMEEVVGVIRRKSDKCKERIVDMIEEAVDRGYLD